MGQAMRIEGTSNAGHIVCPMCLTSIPIEFDSNRAVACENCETIVYFSITVFASVDQNVVAKVTNLIAKTIKENA